MKCPQPITIFYSYAHRDELLRNELEKHLSSLRRQGIITEWHDRQIIAGTNWTQAIDTHLTTASIVLLLISPDFIASDYCYSVEMEQALERHKAHKTRVIPIILRPVDWQDTPFAKFQALPTSGKPVCLWRNRDEAFLDVVRGIRKAINDLKGPSLYVHLPHQSLWNVPYQLNPFFTGREELLNELHDYLSNHRTAALTQALSGLGGIGKTQIAVEYAYRYREEYHSVLWVSAATFESLSTDFMKLASLLHLPEWDAQDQTRTIVAVQEWLASQKDVLLILDNADDLEMVSRFLPKGGKIDVHILLTTRAQAVGALAHPIEIKKMGEQEGILFLLRRARILVDNAELHSLNKTDRDQAEAIVTAMDGLPLALDQAGAYIEETRCSLSDYLNIYRMQRSNLLQQRGLLPIGHPDPVATTWSLSFQEIERTNRAAADLLRLCAFLSPDSILEEIITAGSADLGVALKSIAADLFKFSEAMREVLRYSLLQRDARSKTLSMHRLVQAVVKDGMNLRTQQLWAERAVRAINRAFPTNEVQYWPLCQKYLPHVQKCITHITQWNMIFPEAAQLLDHAGVYLYKRGLYTEAEPLLDQALMIYKQALGPAHLTTVMCMNNLALLYEAQGQYNQAKSLYQQAIDISEQVEGSKHPFTADALYVLTQFYLNQDQYIQAEPLLRRALAIYQNVLGLAHPSTVNALAILGWFYQGHNQTAQSEPLFSLASTLEKQNNISAQRHSSRELREKDSLDHLSLSTLIEYCSQEMNRVHSEGEFNDRYCLEICNRALLRRDPLAWEALQQRFQETVYRWIRHHPKREIICRLDSEESYVNQVFTRLWLSAGQSKHTFSSLAAVLRYLHLILNSLILDTLRTYLQPRQIPLSELDPALEPILEEHQVNEVWQVVQGILHNKRERKLAYLLFYCGLKPRDIVSRFPEEFESVQTVYRLRRNIMEQWHRNIDHLREKLSEN